MSQEFLEVIPILVIFLSAGVALNVGFQLFGRKLITYHLKDKSLEICLRQSYRLIAVPYSTILSVRAVSVVGSMFELRNLRLFNRTIGGPWLSIRLQVQEYSLPLTTPNTTRR